MNGQELKRLAKAVMSAPKAARDTDPHFYSGLGVLPNPDPILRAMGKSDEVYDAIMSDAHVLGELRPIKAGLNGYKFRVKTGSKDEETPEEIAAREVCERWLKREPAPDMTWQDIIWNMGCSVLYGFTVHELIWDVVEDELLPIKVIDRPNRRFMFNDNNELRLLTRQQPTLGEETEDPYFVITRHMPSYSNPYGRAVLSACFWPYTFKKGGFKFFYQFCERYGLPFPIGKYPAGTNTTDQQNLLDALLELVDSGAGTIPDDASVELVETNVSGQLAQESLVNLCNREMSKAITSQTLATENQGVGSNAASKTHIERQHDNSQSNRETVAASFNQIFRWITDLNVGESVTSPEFEFYKEDEPTTERAEQYKVAAELSDRVPLAAFHREMNIPIAEGDEETLSIKSNRQPNQSSEFSACPSCGKHHEFNEGSDDPDLMSATIKAADDLIEQNLVNPIAQMLQEYEEGGKTLAEFYADIEKLGIRVDQQKLSELNAEVIALAFARGMEQEQ